MKDFNEWKKNQNEKFWFECKNGISFYTNNINYKTDQLMLNSMFKNDGNSIYYCSNAIKLFKKEMYSLSTEHSEIIAKLRTETANLNTFQNYFHNNNNSHDFCDCGDARETVSHYLIDCKNFIESRMILRRELREINILFNQESMMQAQNILFPHLWQVFPAIENKDYKTRMNALLTERLAILKSVCDYVKHTQRFEVEFGI